MKKTTLFLLVLNLTLTTFSFSQVISNNAFRLSNSYGALQMRGYIAGDLIFKRALVPRFNAITKTGTLFVNFGGDFKEGTRIMGSKTVLDGKVGIGTRNPDEKLTVKGKIHAEEVRVDLAVPADYVFQKYYTGASALKADYVMPSLEEVASFTKKNHHLPAMPSATQIQKEGLHLKQMTNLLLQKVEELTLYTIEQEERIKALESQVKNTH